MDVPAAGQQTAQLPGCAGHCPRHVRTRRRPWPPRGAGPVCGRSCGCRAGLPQPPGVPALSGPCSPAQQCRPLPGANAGHSPEATRKGPELHLTALGTLGSPKPDGCPAVTLRRRDSEKKCRFPAAAEECGPCAS